MVESKKTQHISTTRSLNVTPHNHQNPNESDEPCCSCWMNVEQAGAGTGTGTRRKGKRIKWLRARSPGKFLPGWAR